MTDAGEISTLQDFPGGVVGVLVGGMGVFVAPGPEVGVFDGTTPAPQQVAGEHDEGIAQPVIQLLEFLVIAQPSFELQMGAV